MNDLHAKAVVLLKQGDSSYLEAGIIIAGMDDAEYGTGVIDKIAHEAKREPKTIYRLKNAGRMWLAIKEVSPHAPPDAPYGMYEAAWTMEQKYQPGALYWLGQIDTAVAENIKIKPFIKFCTEELRETIADLQGKIDAVANILGLALEEEYGRISRIEIRRAYRILVGE